MFQTVSRGVILAVAFVFYAIAAQAQTHATLVMDARTGKVIQSENADIRVHPASLTKMMTLYIVFDQVRQGRLSLDQKITVSANAAQQPPSRLGLKKGQKIELRYLIRAAAIKSANDAATAMGDYIGGSEQGFAAVMNQYARAMGMNHTSFRNANGLTRDGHMSTARDMATLGRRLVYDFPQYYNIFGRVSTSAGIATVRNTNRRVLEGYPGRGRHQDRLHQRRRLQRRLLGAARRPAGDRGGPRRQVHRVAQRRGREADGRRLPRCPPAPASSRRRRCAP